MTQFIYVMDPMCSWCWAFRPAIFQLQNNYPDIPIHYLMGGLAPDTDEKMPTEMQNMIQGIWRQIEDQTGTAFNHAFWEQCQPRRSTYPACRAVISSEALQAGSSLVMIDAIQHAYYEDASNPSDDELLIQLAIQCGLNRDQFEITLHSPETKSILREQIRAGQMIGAQGFPSLFLQQGDNINPIALGYTTSEAVLKRVERYLEKQRNT